jgi:hypothetical protein
MPMLDSTNRGFDFEWSHVFLACVFVVQALNNWGLALQELGAIVPLKEKRAIVKKGIRKFRAAIQLRFDFHRAVYNLGTVLYGLAEDTSRSGQKRNPKELAPADLYSLSAVYIAAAHALKPDYPVCSLPVSPALKSTVGQELCPSIQGDILLLILYYFGLGSQYTSLCSYHVLFT